MRRLDHVREVETGYRSGDPAAALPHEPLPQYDPESTTLTQRRKAKEAELRKAKAMDPALAKSLALHKVSARTLVRWDTARRKLGPIGLSDDRWLREATGHRITPEVREALFAVRDESLRRAKLTARDRERLIHQYVRETFGEKTKVPSYDALRRVWRDWFGSNGGRQRYARSAAMAQKYATGRQEGQFPAFSDARVRESMRELRKRGLAPKSDKELLPVLLEVIGGKIPVDQWPTQLTKKQRTEHAREVTQAAAAAADRPADATAAKPASAAPPPPVAVSVTHTGLDDGKVVPLRWRERAQQGQDAVTNERHRRREAAVPERPTPPPQDLSEWLRSTSLLALPDDDTDEPGAAAAATAEEEVSR